MNMWSHFACNAATSNLATIYTKMMPHVHVYLARFTTVLDRERLRNHIHQITFQLSTYLSRISKGVFLVILVDWLGHTISVRPGPWIRCLWKALSWAWPSSVSDVWGKFALFLFDRSSCGRVKKGPALSIGTSGNPFYWSPASVGRALDTFVQRASIRSEILSAGVCWGLAVEFIEILWLWIPCLTLDCNW